MKNNLKTKSFRFTTFAGATVASVAIGTALMVLPQLVFASFSPSAWQSYRDINLSNVLGPGVSLGSGGSGFTKIVLPDNIANQNNFADVRIVTTNDVEVPYVLTRNTVVHGGEVRGRILDQTAVAGTEQFVIDSGESNSIHTGLSLSSTLQNYRRQVSIYSSSTQLPLNDSRWNIVTSSGYIFRFTDPSSGYSSGKNFVDFPANTSRYIKVVISAGDGGQIGVVGASLYGDRTIDVPSYSESKPVSIFNNTEKRITEITLDMGASGHLTNAINLYPSDQNYSRRVIIESTDDPLKPNNWTYVGQSSISAIYTSLSYGSSNKVQYPEQRARYIKLSVVNDDNRPLSFGSNVLVEGPIISLIFEARPKEAYRLYYGNPKAVLPTYDISAISGYIEENKLPQSYLGPEVKNTSYVAPEPAAVPFGEAYPWILNTVLVLVIVIFMAGIGWYIYDYLKKQGKK